MIKLDKEKKVVLLTALRRGEIDPATLRQWYNDDLHTKTDEELEKELCELDRKLERCDIMKRNGYCQYVKGAHNFKWPTLTAADIIEAAKSNRIPLSDIVAECNRHLGAGEN